MLWTICIILLVPWALDLVTSITLGGLTPLPRVPVAKARPGLPRKAGCT